MKKQIRILMMLLCVTFSVAFSSCKDDDSKESNSAIVGSWTCSGRYYGGSDTYTFSKDGTYSWTYNGTADWFNNQYGTYTFNGTILTLLRQSGYTDVYVVVGLTKSSLVLMDDDGDSYTYIRN